MGEFGRWTAAQRARFGGHPRNRVAEFPTGSHYFFLEMPDDARRVIPSGGRAVAEPGRRGPSAWLSDPRAVFLSS